MKYVPALLLMAFLSAGLSFCSTPRQQMPSTMKSGKGVVREVIPVRVEAVSFQKELAGNWKVLTMRRQQKAELEYLSSASLSFSENSDQFSGKAPCNSIRGNIRLNGYSIRFEKIASTRMGCDQSDQENAMISLLETRISAFTITGNKLYLRDGISNIVFECEREN